MTTRGPQDLVDGATMAEPLLKRTFSRLKHRSRRRKEMRDGPVQSDGVLQDPLTSDTPAADSDSLAASCVHVTVAKKQQWVRQASVAPPTSLSSPSTGDASPPHQRARGPRRPNDQSPSREAAPGVSAKSPVAPDAPPYLPGPAASTKLSGQRAYLQSLDRSSRAWVLASGKSQASDETRGPPPESANNIWYNPIPEEEDAAGPRRDQEVWVHREKDLRHQTRRGPEEEGRAFQRSGSGDARAEQMVRAGSSDGGGKDCPLEAAVPSAGALPDVIVAENTDSPPSDSSPASQKKGGVMDRLRSPGTVRRLSMKMKKLPELRRKLSLRSSSRGRRQACGEETTSKSIMQSDQNVISKYHLDTSAPPARPLRRSSRGRTAGKGGYLSDGDSPELLPRQQAAQPLASETPCDVSSFRLYVGSDPPRSSQRVTGLLTVHLLGLEEMKTSRSDSKEVFVAIQIDGVTRARTALLTLRGSALSLNHAFHLELERARQLRVVVLTPANQQAAGGTKAETDSVTSADRPTRNRVCCLGGVSIPPLFKGSRSQQLCVKLEPRGLLYVKLSLQENWDTQRGSESTGPGNVFGVDLHRLVEEEGSASPVPLLIQKSVAEIERRGLKVVGLYRLCGSAAVKKELRDWFERNSSAVCLSEDLYPDINVITGILKDYLRELPSPLITRTLYRVVREAMILRPPALSPDPELAQSTANLLSCLPPPEKATLSLLLDHLSLVASFSSLNRMTHQNLAVCFGPVLLTPTQEAWRGPGGKRGGGKGGGHGEEMASAVDFKRHIEALHYLLQLWPVPTLREPSKTSPPPSPILVQQHQRLPVLALPAHSLEEVVVSRRGRGGLARLESPPPINRYAGDWSVCGRELLSGHDADYDEVAGSDSDAGSVDEEEEDKKEAWLPAGGGGGGGASDLFVEEFMDFDAPFNCRLSLKDFDTLIHDLDRELAKQINICL